MISIFDKSAFLPLTGKYLIPYSGSQIPHLGSYGVCVSDRTDCVVITVKGRDQTVAKRAIALVCDQQQEAESVVALVSQIKSGGHQDTIRKKILAMAGIVEEPDGVETVYAPSRRRKGRYQGQRA